MNELLWLSIAPCYTVIEACLFLLDWPLVSKCFDHDRNRREVAKELDLSLDDDEGRKRVNQTIALRIMMFALYMTATLWLLYCLLSILELSHIRNN